MERLTRELIDSAEQTGASSAREVSHFVKFMDQVFNGRPGDMFLQGVAAMLGAILRMWIHVNPFVGIYVALVIIDTIMGVRLSRKEGRTFRWSRMLYGPGEKIAFTSLILFAAELMQTYVPGEWLVQAIGAYMSTVLFLEALSKYDKLTGHHILELVRDKFSFVSKRSARDNGTPD